MAKSKPPTKKQIADENDLLKKRLQELEAKLTSQHPTTASQATGEQTPTRQRSINDENNPTANLKTTVSSRSAPTGSTRSPPRRVLADVLQSPNPESPQAKSRASQLSAIAQAAPAHPHELGNDKNNYDRSDEDEADFDYSQPNGHHRNDDFDYHFDYHYDFQYDDGFQYPDNNDSNGSQPPESNSEEEEEEERQSGYGPSNKKTSQPRDRKKKRVTVDSKSEIDLDLNNESNAYICYNADGLIAKPPGEPGRASTARKKGYCLRRAMGYPPELPEGHSERKNARWKKKNDAYNFIHLYTRQVVDLCFEPGVPYLRQELSRRVKAEKAWLAKFPNSPTMYEKNWPMDALFSTILQNYNKKTKSGKSKKPTEEDNLDEDDNPFAISLPGGRVLGSMAAQGGSSDPETLDTKRQQASSSRTSQHYSSSSSHRRHLDSSSSHPQSSTKSRHASGSTTTSPLTSRAPGPQLGFNLACDPPPKRKAADRALKKRSAPASRKGKEVDNKTFVDPEAPERPLHKPRPRPKVRAVEKVAWFDTMCSLF